MHIIGFLSEWQSYAQQLSTQLSAGWSGSKIEKSKIDKMSDEQLTMLYDLMKATTEETQETDALIDKITQKG